MVDLYLQALLQGEVLRKGIRSYSKEKSIFEDEIKKQIDDYINNLADIPDQNRYQTPQMKIAKIKADLEEEAIQSELTEYVNLALQLLSKEAQTYLSEDQNEELRASFLKAEEMLEYLDLQAPWNENFKTLLQFSDDAIDSIASVALALYREDRFDDALALYVLLETFSPETPQFWYQAGISAHARGNEEFALKQYQAAYTLDETLVGAKIFIAECLLKLQRFEEAKKNFAEIKQIKEFPSPDFEERLKDLMEALDKSLI